MLGNRGFPEAWSHLCICWSLLPHDLCHGRSSSCWLQAPLSYFESWKMMLWKCCTQYVNKFWKLSSGHSTGKGQFSFQSQRRAMSKNAQTTAQLHSSHRLVMWCSKFSKPGFSNTWTMNSLMSSWFYKRQRNQRSNCQHLLDHGRSKRVPEKHVFLLYWLYQILLLCGSQ